MIELDGSLAREYLAECREHLAHMESDLPSLDDTGGEIDEERLNRAFRAIHSIKGGATFFNLVRVGELASQMEKVVALIGSREVLPTPERVAVLLRAADRMRELLRHPGSSNRADIAEIRLELVGLCADRPLAAGKASTSDPVSRPLRMLLAEDDFSSRLLLQTFLSRFGECHVAVNGKEAVEAFRSGWELGQTYDLICMDIMMPIMDGTEAVRQVRAFEKAHGILSTQGTKIIMTTTVDDIKEVIRCFRELCDAYLMKPIDLSQLLEQMREYRLLD